MRRVFKWILYSVVGVLFVFTVFVIIVAIFVDSDDTWETTNTQVSQIIVPTAGPEVISVDRLGAESAYIEIEAMTNCRDLQVQFNTSMDNRDASSRRNGSNHPITLTALSYAKFTDEHMRKVGCY